MTISRHGVELTWSVPGYFGLVGCQCCGFSMIGENRVLTAGMRGQKIQICDGCVNAIAEISDGQEYDMNGNPRMISDRET